MYLKQITFTRFLAAIWVVLFHREGVFSNPSIIGFISKGNLGVSFFFVLSGYVMMLAYYKNGKPFSLSQFYLNRVARIYPLYLVATLLSIIFKYFLFDKVFSLGDNILNILVLQAYFFPFSSTISEVFGLGWSLTTEFLFYAIFPFLLTKVYLSASKTLKQIAFIVFIVWVISVGGSSFLQNGYDTNIQIHDFIFHFPVWHINQFLIGNLFGMLFILNRDSEGFFSTFRKYGDIWLIGMFLFLAISLKILPFWQNKYVFFPYVINVHNGFLAYLFAAIILVLSFNKGIITRIFSNSLLILLGEISYAIYLLQEIAIFLWDIMIQKLSLSLTPLNNLFGYILFLIFISYLGHVFVEKPCLKLIKRFYK